MNKTDETLFEFPCDFPIKAMGKIHEDFEQLVVNIIDRHVDDISTCKISTRNSKSNGYLAVTVIIRAHSKQQLDAIYTDLTATTEIIMAL
ncbi:MAG: DUF493 domain-containing protein [Gammaproteobacteria bacterium]|nr:DUF493 domain-containing protein [Gammaproteobacteria bacterium]